MTELYITKATIHRWSQVSVSVNIRVQNNNYDGNNYLQ